MKLGSLKSKDSRDGDLVVVSHDHRWAVRVPKVAPSLRQAVEAWAVTKPQLEKVYADLSAGRVKDAMRVNEEEFHAPLPRAFQWVDGSAFLHHVKLVRMARKAPIPESLYSVPLMYQGGSDDFLAPREDIPQVDFAHGTDFEGEVAVITTDVPLGVKPDAALNHVALLMIVNDVSLRGLIPEELGAGFGFLQSKPSSAFAPFAVTPDELGGAWRDGRVHLPLSVTLNGEFFGNANAGQMHFHFGQLIAHAARTRRLSAGTIVGSGTVSNEDPAAGSSCLVEKRMIEQIQSGAQTTSYMKVGDRVRIEMRDESGNSLFGAIEQKVAAHPV